jgi:eukaryotic-like serine/threonine-protein kinase
MKGASATSLAGKIFFASALLVVAVLGITFGVTSLQANRTADAAIHRALLNTRRAVENFLAARTRTVAAVSAASGQIPQFRQRLFTSRSRAEILDQAQEYQSLIAAGWVLVTDKDGILLARTDYPEEYDRDLSKGALIATALSGDQAHGAFIDDRDSTNIRLYVAVATPLRDRPEAAPQGVLVAAYALDDSLAAAIRGATNSDVVFFAFPADSAQPPALTGSTLARDELGPALAALHAGRLGATADSGMALATAVGGEHLVGLAAPVRSAAGDPFGGFVAFRSRDAELAAFRTLQRTIVVALALGVLLALASAFLLARRIAGPVRRLALAARRVQDGDYAVDVTPESRDEIGALSLAFRSLIEDLKEKAALVEYMMQASGAAATQPLALPRLSIASGGDMLRPGTVFANRYEVKGILGAGGMGVVYRAIDRELQEPVAIKTLRPEALRDATALERFKQEIRLARKIAHRNVVRTYDLGELNGMYYLTMEYVEGTSLKQLIESRGKLPVSVTLTVGKQLCRALEVAHQEGVIHRDIKPQNLVVDPSGFLKVMDFGIARLVNPPKGKGLTEAGVSIGTPDYMSPEQLTGAELDARSDLYSAGVVLFECVTGRLPFQADTVYALIAKHIEEEPPNPRGVDPGVPEALARVILKAMAKQSAARYRSAGELHDALAAIG